jgi:hypothetical protein
MAMPQPETGSSLERRLAWPTADSLGAREAQTETKIEGKLT